MQLPKKIEPCYIKEAIVELRFEAKWPVEVILGMLYNSVKEVYKEPLERLPILDIPVQLRDADPNLAHTPYFRLKNKNYLVQIGPRAISIIVGEPYSGWDSFKAEARYICDKVHELDFITNVTRVGIRYIDFFDFDIIEKINLSVSLSGADPKTIKQTFVRLGFNEDRFQCTFQIGNQMQSLVNNEKSQVGSVIDVDTYMEGSGIKFFDEMESILETAHDIQKRLFFHSLKPEFLDSLNPTYE